MGVRKIKISNRALTGSFSSKKKASSTEFESSLERDFICILEFDDNIDTYQEQPLTIQYRTNRIHSYTPDFLVEYRKDIKPAKWFKDTIFEVKYKKELELKKLEFEPKFKAAEEYARLNSMDFKVINENDIRTDYLFNAKFLLGYKTKEFDFRQCEHISKVLENLRFTTPHELLIVISSNEQKRAEFLHTIWFMVSVNMIGCNLSKKLTMNSEIWFHDSNQLKNFKPCKNG